MADDIKTTKTFSIAESGHDEFWLCGKIFDDPTILGLGDLQSIATEKTQPQGGRLDLLLKDLEDNSMYEVELQLGPTDESHIIRTIEYWDNAKKQWPRRSHTAVLVAEEINRRFFNVVQLLSLSVPIIGIQANIVQIGDTKALHFTKMIDSYEEPEEKESTQQTYDEKHWIDNYPKSLECVRWYHDLLGKYYGDIPIKYFKFYITFKVGGIIRVWISKLKDGRAFIELKYIEQPFNEATDYLTNEAVAFTHKNNRYIRFDVNSQQLKDKKNNHEWLAQKLAPSFLMHSK